MNNAKPLDDLEMFELLQACYPDRFPDESDESWDAALEMAGDFGDFDSLADLLGRVVMLAPTLESPLSGTRRHVLGSIEGNAFVAVVSREVAPYHGEQIAALYASQPAPESEAVRRDAERYRWLLQECYRWPPAGRVCGREDQTRPVAIWTTIEGDDVGAAIDAAIDKARGKEVAE